jgi:hypothetical protein
MRAGHRRARGAAVSTADAEDIMRARATWKRPGARSSRAPGALIVNLRNILEAMDAVATAQRGRAHHAGV